MSDVSANFRCSNQPLSARNTASKSWAKPVQSRMRFLKRAFIPKERVDSEQRALDGRERGAAFGFGLFGPVQNGHNRTAVARTVDEPGLVSTHLDTAVAVRIESVAIEAA